MVLVTKKRSNLKLQSTPSKPENILNLWIHKYRKFKFQLNNASIHYFCVFNVDGTPSYSLCSIKLENLSTSFSSMGRIEHICIEHLYHTPWVYYRRFEVKRLIAHAWKAISMFNSLVGNLVSFGEYWSIHGILTCNALEKEDRHVYTVCVWER